MKADKILNWDGIYIINFLQENKGENNLLLFQLPHVVIAIHEDLILGHHPVPWQKEE